mgnify:CR=1 FL=1
MIQCERCGANLAEVITYAFDDDKKEHPEESVVWHECNKPKDAKDEEKNQ